MQTTVDRRTLILAGIIVVLVAAVAFLLGAGLTRDNAVTPVGMMGNASGMGMHGGATGAGDLSGSDVMFLQMMIPHHQQAVDMSGLALATSTDEELRALATEIRDGQAAEIIQMEGWLADAGLPSDLDHPMGMGMGGMLTDSELATLAGSSGAPFDSLWLAGMIRHHEGALHMIGMIQDSANPDLQEFSESIRVVQTAQIEQMQDMLVRLAA
ncbi:MAG: DUF305 domain-containing protein [Actinomycetota bacterium]|nr:DUF305 domain-containing protein [Actinomycetota bacterium]